MIAWYEIVGNVLIGLGTVSLLLGTLGILRFRSFTMKVLSSAKIDTVAFIFLAFGTAFRSGSGWFAVKVLLLLLIVLLGSPIVSSQILSRARQSGEQ